MIFRNDSRFSFQLYRFYPTKKSDSIRQIFCPLLFNLIFQLLFQLLFQLSIPLNSKCSNVNFRFQARFNPIKSDKFSVIFKFAERCCPLNVCQSDIFFPKSLRVTVQAQKLTRPDSLSSFRFRCPMLEIDSQSKTL